MFSEPVESSETVDDFFLNYNVTQHSPYGHVMDTSNLEKVEITLPQISPIYEETSTTSQGSANINRFWVDTGSRGKKSNISPSSIISLSKLIRSI